jgi:hypothetical protein
VSSELEARRWGSAETFSGQRISSLKTHNAIATTSSYYS